MADQQQLQPKEMNAARIGGGLNNLPPGFRFHPSDDEIVSLYLMKKVQNRHFTSSAIAEVDINKTEPWDLPRMAKMGEKEWYFFCQKDRKYPTGLRANRATEAGYWKATGKDNEVYKTIEGVVQLIGMKKTLVFYEGRAPRGEKTNWVMHEYRLEGSDKRLIGTTSSSASASKDEWVVCRLFDKTTRVKKMNAPVYQVAMAGTNVDQNQNNISAIPIPMPLQPPVLMPMPMQFPILQDFAIDPVGPYYPNASTGILPLAGISGAGGLLINDTLFGNPLAMVPQMNFDHHMGMGIAAGGGGFNVATSESRPCSVVSQNDEQANGVEISSRMSVAGQGSEATTIEMVDGIWKY